MVYFFEVGYWFRLSDLFTAMDIKVVFFPSISEGSVSKPPGYGEENF